MNILGLFKPAIILPPIAQQTDSHCGPAVVQLLLAHLSKNFTQDEIVTAARVRTQIMRNGTRPDQLAHAVAKLTPDLKFWFKQRTTVEDLNILIKKYHWPVAVNWQGLFYETDEEQQRKNPHGDYGHYSVAIHITPEKDKITIADPYSEFAKKPRVFSLHWFEDRWWDVDRVKDKKTGRRRTMKTQRLIFVIAPPDATFPKELGMKPASQLPVLK